MEVLRPGTGEILMDKRLLLDFTSVVPQSDETLVARRPGTLRFGIYGMLLWFRQRHTNAWYDVFLRLLKCLLGPQGFAVSMEERPFYEVFAITFGRCLEACYQLLDLRAFSFLMIPSERDTNEDLTEAF